VFDHIFFRFVDSTMSRPDKDSAHVPYVANTIMGTVINPDVPFALPYWDTMQLIGLNGAVETIIDSVPTNLNLTRYSSPMVGGVIDTFTGDITTSWFQISEGWKALGTAAGAIATLNAAYLWDFNGISLSKTGNFTLSGLLVQQIGVTAVADAICNFDPLQIDPSTAITMVDMTIAIPVIGNKTLSSIYLACNTTGDPAAIFPGVFSQFV